MGRRGSVVLTPFQTRATVGYPRVMDAPSPPPPPPSAPPPTSPAPATRAAVAVWVAAAIQVILFGGCALLLGLAAMSPEAQLRQATGEMPAQITAGQMRIVLWAFAGLIALTMWVPGLVLLFLGFGVKEGRRGQTLAAAVILVVQAVLLGFFVLLPTVNTLLEGGPLIGVAVHLLVFGGLLWIVVWAARRALLARRAATAPMFDAEEPWNRHLG